MYKHANGTTPETVKNTWDAPTSASFDFRSDTMTSPTASMLAAITNCSLFDDVFSEDSTTNDLEAFCAKLANKPASLLVLSGTMGNQLALRAHLGAPPHMILTDHRSHIVNYEAGGAASMCGAMVKAVVPKNGHHLTLEDIEAHAVLSDDIHACPTKVISLENTLNGTITPLEDVRRISAWARERGIIVHMDGARLWEAAVAGAGKLEEYCDAVDSVSLCFSKGLGAPIGSVLVGQPDFIRRARWVRKSIGGGLRQAGVVSAAARVAVEETYLGGLLKGAQENAKRVQKMWEALGGKLEYPAETNMVWLDLGAHGIKVEDFIKAGQKRGLKIMGSRLVIHYQITEESLARLEATMKDVLQI